MLLALSLDGDILMAQTPYLPYCSNCKLLKEKKVLLQVSLNTTIQLPKLAPMEAIQVFVMEIVVAHLFTAMAVFINNLVSSVMEQDVSIFLDIVLITHFQVISDDINRDY